MKAHRLAGTAAVVVVVLAAGCTADGPATPPAGTPAPEPSGCSAAVREDVLPEWSRAGFSDPSPSGIPYVVGDRGDILGVIFGYPLVAPPRSAGPSNKILWNANPAAGGTGSAQDGTVPNALVIDARLAGTAEVVRREVPGGPGPSIIDLPGPGCWQLTLTWSGHTDTLDLRYESQAK